jgi:geranylgeranyl diphosphate synthase type II
MKEAKMMIQTFLSKTAAAVNDWVDLNVKARISTNNGVYEAMRYTLLTGGKSLRAALFIATYNLERAFHGNMSRHPVLPYAAAVEMAHAYSLIHDDLPSMDNDDYRRGKPSNHKVFGEANAVLAGDGLLTLAALIFASTRDNIPPNRKLVALTTLLEALGPDGMVGGQYLDINYSAREVQGDIENLLEITHTQKTALFISASVSCGAILAGFNAGEVEAFSQYGRDIGLAFQIIDDILDAKSAEKGKLTYPSVYGIKKSRALAAEYIETAKRQLQKINKDTAVLSELADFIYDRTA